MKSFVVVSCLAVFLIGTCLAIDAVSEDSGQSSDIFIPDIKDVALQEADQLPAETKHWWHGHKYDWNRAHHGGHQGGHWELNHGTWWWKWH